jgi:hypothetical protein
MEPDHLSESVGSIGLEFLTSNSISISLNFDYRDHWRSLRRA